jgi:hypothetical protein
MVAIKMAVILTEKEDDALGSETGESEDSVSCCRNVDMDL